MPSQHTRRGHVLQHLGKDTAPGAMVDHARYHAAPCNRSRWPLVAFAAWPRTRRPPIRKVRQTAGKVVLTALWRSGILCRDPFPRNAASAVTAHTRPILMPTCKHCMDWS